MADLCFPKGPPHFFLYKAPESPPDDAVSEDRTHLDDFEGWMTKQSVRGFWQQRYFALNNGYLNYYADKTRPALLGSLDLSKVSSMPQLGVQTPSKGWSVPCKQKVAVPFFLSFLCVWGGGAAA